MAAVIDVLFVFPRNGLLILTLLYQDNEFNSQINLRKSFHGNCEIIVCFMLSI